MKKKQSLFGFLIILLYLRNIISTILKKMGNSFKNITNDIIICKELLLPHGRTEWVVLLCSFFFFLSFAILFFLHKRLEPPEMLGYDTSAHMLVDHMKIDIQHLFSWDIRHPLLRFMFLPPILIDILLSFFHIDIKWEVFTLYSTIISSYTGLILFKILSMICNKMTAILLLCLFYSFAHSILLSIQIDSFIFSMFFLITLILVYLYNYQSNIINNWIFWGLVGTTSTNVLKFFIYALLTSGGKFKKAIYCFVESSVVFISLFAITIWSFLNRLFVQHLGLKYSLLAQTLDYRGTSTNKFILLFENFICEPILFHNTHNLLYTKETRLLESYPSFICYIPPLVIILAVIISLYKNIYDRITKLFFLFISIDFFIHFIIGYGIEEGQIFCAHWFFFIPILLGLLDNKIKNIYIQRVYLFTIFALFVFLLFYNFRCFFLCLYF